MKANLFKNFKTLKEKEDEKKLADDVKVDNVSVVEIPGEDLKIENELDISSGNITTNVNGNKEKPMILLPRLLVRSLLKRKDQ